jgi:hypothetical protein
VSLCVSVSSKTSLGSAAAGPFFVLDQLRAERQLRERRELELPSSAPVE